MVNSKYEVSYKKNVYPNIDILTQIKI